MTIQSHITYRLFSFSDYSKSYLYCCLGFNDFTKAASPTGVAEVHDSGLSLSLSVRRWTEALYRKESTFHTEHMCTAATV